MAAKRSDSFQAETRIVWDVDPRAHCVRAYLIGSPAAPILFVRGQIANAEPVVPGWRLAVDDLFA